MSQVCLLQCLCVSHSNKDTNKPLFLVVRDAHFKQKKPNVKPVYNIITTKKPKQNCTWCH